jgi:GT2 family glycosyltransferase
VIDCPELASANRVEFEPPDPPPACTIVIPTRDHATLLERCIESVRRHTDYPAYALCVVDNGSRDPATLALLERLRAEGIKVLRHDIDFNFSRLNNLAIAETSTPFVCLMNDDVEVVAAGWLRTMIAAAARPDVAVVGARLWYPDRCLQHAGIVLGIAGAAGHLHKHLPEGDPGYFGRAVLQQEFSAVTAACMLVRRSVYEELGGLDEQFPVAYGDVDFCLRVRRAGHRVVWAPAAELIHRESATRGADTTGERERRLRTEQEHLRQRWAEWLDRDPAYSPNLTLDREDCGLAWPPR